MNYINILVFVVSFIIGLIFIQLSAPNTEMVFVYPTPENAGSVEYKDKVGNCYVFKSKSVKCPKDGVKQIPVQE